MFQHSNFQTHPKKYIKLAKCPNKNPHHIPFRLVINLCFCRFISHWNTLSWMMGRNTRNPPEWSPALPKKSCIKWHKATISCWISRRSSIDAAISQGRWLDGRCCAYRNSCYGLELRDVGFQCQCEGDKNHGKNGELTIKYVTKSIGSLEFSVENGGFNGKTIGKP